MTWKKGVKCTVWAVAVLLLSLAWWFPIRGGLASALKESGWYWTVFVYAVPVLLVVSFALLVLGWASIFMKKDLLGFESSNMCRNALVTAGMLLWVEAVLALGLAWTAVVARDLILGLEPLAWYWNALVLGVLAIGSSKGSCGGCSSCGTCDSEEKAM